MNVRNRKEKVKSKKEEGPPAPRPSRTHVNRGGPVARLLPVLLVLVWTTSAAAFQGQDAFVPLSELQRETLPAAPLVYGAYAFAWTALLVYVWMLWRRLTRVERELADAGARQESGRR